MYLLDRYVIIGNEYYQRSLKSQWRSENFIYVSLFNCKTRLGIGLLIVVLFLRPKCELDGSKSSAAGQILHMGLGLGK
jgi:hypothetical protein